LPIPSLCGATAAMLKVVGAILVLCAGALIGLHMSHQYASRPRQIRQLIQALQRLETEISYGATPLAEAFHSIARQAAGPVAVLLGAAAEELQSESADTRGALERSAERCWGRTALRPAEREIWLHLGSILGVSDRDDQIRHLRLAMSQLKSEEDAAQEDQRRYASMWRSLGLLGGALVAILLY